MSIDAVRMMESARHTRRKAKQKEILKKILAYSLLTIGAFLMVIPLIWTVSTAFKEEVNVQDGRWIPKPLTVDNFKIAWEKGKFGKAYRNSLLVSALVTIGQVFTSALAAYAFARLFFPFRDRIFLGYLGTMMVPFVVIMIPNFILLKNLGMTDNPWGLVLPAMFSAYGTFMLRQFFLSIPKDLEEAAVIDGATKVGIFFRIILPLSKAALATLTTFTFIFQWNDFMWPLIVISADEWKTLPLMLATFNGTYASQIALIMAASLIVLIPVIVVFVLNQKFITKGIMMSGLKE